MSGALTKEERELVEALRSFGAFAGSPASDHFEAAAKSVVALCDRLCALVETLQRSASILPSLDCRYTGAGYADIDGKHCPIEKPCQRCEFERRIEKLEAVAKAADSVCSWQIEDLRLPECWEAPDGSGLVKSLLAMRTALSALRSEK